MQPGLPRAPSEPTPSLAYFPSSRRTASVELPTGRTLGWVARGSGGVGAPGPGECRWGPGGAPHTSYFSYFCTCREGSPVGVVTGRWAYLSRPINAPCRDVVPALKAPEPDEELGSKSARGR